VLIPGFTWTLCYDLPCKKSCNPFRTRSSSICVSRRSLSLSALPAGAQPASVCPFPLASTFASSGNTVANCHPLRTEGTEGISLHLLDNLPGHLPIVSHQHYILAQDGFRVLCLPSQGSVLVTDFPPILLQCLFPRREFRPFSIQLDGGAEDVALSLLDLGAETAS